MCLNTLLLKGVMYYLLLCIDHHHTQSNNVLKQ